jgi:ABC-type lipoprotein release transport system permease subunit
MQNSFLNFLFLLVDRHKKKHIAVFLLATLLVTLLASLFFIRSSIKHDALLALHEQPDFTIQKLEAGRSVDIPVERIEKYAQMPGVSYAAPRVFGRYFTPDREHYFTIVGVDFFDEQLVTWIAKLFKEIDIKSFLAKENMIIGDGVRNYMKSHYYESYYNFLTPQGKEKKINIYDHLPKSANLIANDIILMDIDLAREILGISADKATDIILGVPNPMERDNIKFKLLSQDFDTRIITKESLEKEYENLYNYKGGIFLLGFIIVLITFMLILFQRYTMINSSERKEIALLRAVGWSIKDVIRMKLYENLTIALLAFAIGTLLAYGYVFFMHAPLLKEVFLGFGNLDADIAFTPVIDFGMLVSIFLFFIVPFLASVLIPVWKIAITDPAEALK